MTLGPLSHTDVPMQYEGNRSEAEGGRTTGGRQCRPPTTVGMTPSMAMASLGTLLLGVAALLATIPSLLSQRRLHRKADDQAVATATVAATTASIDASVNNIEPGQPTIRQSVEQALTTAQSTHRLVLGHVEQDAVRFDRIDHRLGLPPIEPEDDSQ